MTSSSSKVDLPSDWAVVSTLSESFEKEKEPSNYNEGTSSDSELNEYTNVTLFKHAGSQVDDILEESDNYSRSSSDIDVIDENTSDDSPEKRFTCTPSPLLAISTSTETTTSLIETPTTENVNEAEKTENPTPNPNPNLFWTLVGTAGNWIGERNREDWSRNVGFILLLTVVTALTIKSTPPINTKKDSSLSTTLEQQEKLLTLENKNLILERQNEEVFAQLEEQMKEVKNENLKLQEHILAFQKQSTGQDKKTDKDFYKTEINQLKEQVNILKIDNEELQKQLVRMRYGSYISSKSDDTGEKDEENMQTQETLSNEVRELRKDLQEEVSKLQKLNELIEMLTKELHQKSDENKDSLSSEKEFHGKEKTKKKRESFDWGWKDVKKNIKDAVHNFQNLNISGLFSKYVEDKKMHLEDAFKSIGHYFKAAQKEVESHFPDNFKEQWKHDIKSTLEDLNGKWSIVKNEFFKFSKSSKESSTIEKDNEPEFSNSYSKSPNAENVHPRKHKHGKFKKPPTEEYRTGRKKGGEVEDLEMSTISGTENNLYFEHGEKYGTEDTESTDVRDESWVFDRAAERAKLRVDEEEEALVNWYLKKNKKLSDESH